MGKKVFNKELLYVALSRCKWFAGLVLVNMTREKFLISLKPNIQKIKYMNESKIKILIN